MVRSTSRKSSWLRSFISFSVNTVTDWGMSLMSCLPLPTVVFLMSRVSLPWTSAVSFTVTVDRVVSGVLVCAMAPIEAASISAPSGSKALSDCEAWGDRVAGEATNAGEERSMPLRRWARDLAKRASVNRGVQVARRGTKSRREAVARSTWLCVVVQLYVTSNAGHSHLH